MDTSDAGTDGQAVAIIGLACRLPCATDADALWDMLMAGREAIREVPPERFDIDSWFDPEPGRADRIGTRVGGFLEDVDRFDAAFFDVSAHEAVRWDPQHRLILRNVWEAIEDAGLDAATLAGSATGVYSSCLVGDYWDKVRDAGMYDVDAASGTGAWGMPASRVSRFFDLRGPSMGVEAACSSSLLCVHLAVQDLRAGRSELAIVTSANLLLAPDLYLGLSEAEMLSPDGRCRFGEAAATGYMRSEGVATVLLKPLRAARRDGDRVYAAIVGSAANNNGATNPSMLATSVPGQTAVLRAALRDAGVPPAHIDYVEAHGTGTPVGDTVELTALRAVLADGRDPRHPCLVGSLKSNIGHCETAAGLAGLVKTALAVHHRRIPATLHVRAPNAVVADADSPLRLARHGLLWPDTGRLALAGVSSFGLNATNVHVVVREVEQAPVPVRTAPEGLLLPLSARDDAALRERALRCAAAIDDRHDESFDQCFTAAVRSTHHTHRIAVTGADSATIAAGLRAFASGRGEPTEVTAGRPRVVFVFPGQGGQWAGMGRGMAAASPVFREALAECDAAISEETGWSVTDLLHDETFLVDRDPGTDVVQPALFAVQVALHAQWRHWGIRPDLVIGHSMGEVAAACAAGALSIRDAAAVICRRSKLVTTLRRPGAMYAVQLGEDDARRAIGEHTGRVEVGVVNSPGATVLAGDPDAVAAVVTPLLRRGVHCRRINVEYASHSSHVAPLHDELVMALADIRPRSGTVPLQSTVLGRSVDGAELDARYWAANLREPVRFMDAVRAAAAEGRQTLFVELSPHPTLLSAIEDTVEGEAVVFGSLMRDEPERPSMLSGLAAAYAHGCDPDWAAVFPDGRFTRSLPGHPWREQRYWPEARPAPPPVGYVGAHDLDGSGDLDDELFAFESERDSSWLDALAHTVDALAGGPALSVHDLVAPLVSGVLDGPGAMRVEMREQEGGWRFRVRVGHRHRRGVTRWREHAAGVVRPVRVATPRESVPMVRRWCAEPVTDERANGLLDLRRRDGEALAALAPGTAAAGDVLDLCGQALRAAAPTDAPVGRDVGVPVELRVFGPLSNAVWIHARLHHVEPPHGPARGDVRLLDVDGLVVAELREAVVRAAPAPTASVTPSAPSAVPGGDSGRRFLSMVAELLDIAPGELDASVTLTALGINSLQATRLRGTLARESGLHLPLEKLLGQNTVARLVDLVNARS